MAGAKEWGPKEEPPEAEFEFAGLKILTRRTGDRGWRRGEEKYDVAVTAPNGGEYRYFASVREMDKYHGLGHLDAALAALTDIAEVKEDFDTYRGVLRRWTRKEAADVLAAMASRAAEDFPAETVQQAADLVSAEMRKVPSVQRKLQRSWEELMRRRKKE